MFSDPRYYLITIITVLPSYHDVPPLFRPSPKILSTFFSIPLFIISSSSFILLTYYLVFFVYFIFNRGYIGRKKNKGTNLRSVVIHKLAGIVKMDKLVGSLARKERKNGRTGYDKMVRR